MLNPVFRIKTRYKLIVSITFILIGLVFLYQFLVSSNYFPAVMDITMTVDSSTRGQIFFEYDGRYYAKKSTSFYLNAGQKYRYTIKLPERNLRELRIDPLEEIGKFSIHSINISSSNRTIIKWDSPSLRRQLLPNNQVRIVKNKSVFSGVSLGNDPILTLKLPQGFNRYSFSGKMGSFIKSTHFTAAIIASLLIMGSLLLVTKFHKAIFQPYQNDSRILRQFEEFNIIRLSLLEVLSLGKQNKLSTIVVMFWGAFLGLTSQLNWLLIVKDKNWEKSENLRMILGPISGVILLLLIWLIYLTVLNSISNITKKNNILLKDALTFSPLLLTSQVFWGQSIQQIYLYYVVILWIVLKILLYPDVIIEIFKKAMPVSDRNIGTPSFRYKDQNVSEDKLIPDSKRPSPELKKLPIDGSLIKLDRVGKSFIGVLIILLFLLSGMKVHYSSIPIWDSYVPYQDAFIKKSVVFGSPKAVRSDEWLVSAPALLGEYYKGNNIYRNPSILSILTPWNWGYLIDQERGFSFSWNFWRFGSFLGFFLLLMLLTKSNFWLSVSGSLFIFFASFNRWWEFSSWITLFSFIFIFFIYFLYSKKSTHIIGSYILLGIFLKQFVFIFYPAFQVPLSWLLIFLVVGFSLDNDILQAIKPKKNLKLALVIVGIGLAGILLARWFENNREVLLTILNTVYPGKRVSTGGDMSIAKFFSGYFDIYLSEGKYLFGNICETSNFILLYPIIVIITAFQAIKGSKPSYLKLFLCLYLIVLTFFCIVGFSPFFAKITLMSFSTGNRAIIGVGFANTLLIMVFLATGNRIKLSVYIKLILIPLFFVVFYYFGKHLQLVTRSNFIDLSKIVFICVIFSLLSYLLVKKRSFAFCFILLLLVFIPGYGKNPISSGLEPIYGKKITKFILDIEKKHPDQKWVVYGSHILPNFLKATGADIFNGVVFPPDLKSMKILDPLEKNKNVFNRYAHIVFIRSDSEIPSFVLKQTDLYEIHIDPCSKKLQDVGIQYMVFPSSYFETPHFMEKLHACGGVQLNKSLLNDHYIFNFHQIVNPVASH